MRVTVVGSGFVGQTTAHAAGRTRPGGGRADRHRRGPAAGLGPRPAPVRPRRRVRAQRDRHQRLRGHRRLRRRRDHRRVPPSAGDEPDGPARQERRDRARRGRTLGPGLAERDHHRGHEPAGRDDVPRRRGLRLPQGTGHGDGGGARLGAPAGVHRRGARRVAARRRGDDARVARRVDGAAASPRDRRWEAAHRDGRRGDAPAPVRADARRRRRDRWAAEEGERVLRPLGFGRADGRGDRRQLRRACCLSARGARASTASTGSTSACP